jgi:hypothetical protein
VPPAQVATPPVGAGQGTQAVPQLFGLVSSTQKPLQACLPLGQPQLPV